MPRLPDKELFHITEVVWLVAPQVHRSHAAVERQIYRGIEGGSIKARLVLGRKMLAHSEVKKIIEGEPA